MPLLGAHLSIAGGCHKAVESAVGLDCDTVQLFTKNANQWQARDLSEDDVSAFRRALRHSRLRLALGHDSYLINLASPNPQLYHRSLAAFIGEVQRPSSWACATWSCTPVQRPMATWRAACCG